MRERTRCAPCSGARRISSTCRPRSPSRSAPCSRWRRRRPAREIRTRLTMLRERVGSSLAMPAWRAAACLAAIAAGYFAMRWPEATASIAIRRRAPGVHRRCDRFARRAGVGGLGPRRRRPPAIGTAAGGRRDRGDRRDQRGLLFGGLAREGAAGAEGRPCGHGRSRLQRARRVCATGASTRSSWPAPTTRWRQLHIASCSLATRTASGHSWRAACGRSWSTSTTAPACRPSSAPTSAARPRRTWCRPSSRRPSGR